jgi:acyl-CoA thioesterase-2
VDSQFMMCEGTDESIRGARCRDGGCSVIDMGAAIDRWLAALTLAQLAPSTFRGFAPPGRRRRTFGGMVMGQALVAAAHGMATARQRPLSVHCEFVRAGDPALPIEFDVAATSGGRRFTTRTVVGRQGDRLLFTVLARFHADDAGPDFQVEVPVAAPAPAALPDFPTHVAANADRVPDWADGDSPIDVRMIEEAGMSGQRSWVRIGDGSASGRLASGDVDASIVAVCGLLYASDMTLIGTAPKPFGRAWSDDDVVLASLDHAMWFHRGFDLDGWLLYGQRVLSVAGARALCLGEIYATDGSLVATVIQGGLLELAFSRVDRSSTI